MKEYDVPYHVRFAIDRDLRAGQWFTATAVEGHVSLAPRKDLIFRAEPRVCAFDIETTKLPLHFPNAEHDQVSCPAACASPLQRSSCAHMYMHVHNVVLPCCCHSRSTGAWHEHSLTCAAGAKQAQPALNDLQQRQRHQSVQTSRMQVFMISYMLDKQGYLIVNRKVVGGDIAAFEYTPKPEFAGPFEVFNEADERATLQRWFSHMAEVRPNYALQTGCSVQPVCCMLICGVLACAWHASQCETLQVLHCDVWAVLHRTSSPRGCLPRASIHARPPTSPLQPHTRPPHRRPSRAST